MNIHGIETDSMLNGDGLRVVLWVAGCEHKCYGCQNPQTWSVSSGREMTFDDVAYIAREMSKDYISGITFSGGDPMHPANRNTVLGLARTNKQMLPEKTNWLYTGYLFEELLEQGVDLSAIDVLVDGKFEMNQADVNYPWAGSMNQRVIDVQKSLREGKVVLHGA